MQCRESLVPDLCFVLCNAALSRPAPPAPISLCMSAHALCACRGHYSHLALKTCTCTLHHHHHTHVPNTHDAHARTHTHTTHTCETHARSQRSLMGLCRALNGQHALVCAGASPRKPKPVNNVVNPSLGEEAEARAKHMASDDNEAPKVRCSRFVALQANHVALRVNHVALCERCALVHVRAVALRMRRVALRARVARTLNHVAPCERDPCALVCLSSFFSMLQERPPVKSTGC